MLFKDFARRHHLCDYGKGILERDGHRDLREMWHENGSATELFWLLSRAQVDQSALIRCACVCAREALPLFPDPAAPRDAIDLVEAWCDRSSSYQSVVAAGEQAGIASESEGVPRAASLAWDAIQLLTRCASSTVYAPGVTSYIAVALAAGGKGTSEENQARLAGIVRSSFSFDEVEQAVAADAPSPDPRQTTVDEVLDQSAGLIRAVEELQHSWDASKTNLENVYAEAQVSADKVRRFTEEMLSREDRERLAQELAKLDVPDEVAASPAPAGSAGPRRFRRMV